MNNCEIQEKPVLHHCCLEQRWQDGDKGTLERGRGGQEQTGLWSGAEGQLQCNYGAEDGSIEAPSGWNEMRKVTGWVRMRGGNQRG